MYSLIRLIGDLKSVEWNAVRNSGTPVPRPRFIRPPEVSSTSAAALAASNGERVNAAAKPVHSSAREVVSAEAVSIANGLR